MEKEEIKLSLENTKVRIREKTNGIGELRKMKIYLDLDKTESVSYKNVLSTLKPDNVKEHEFVKSLFLLGLGTYVDRLKEMKEKYEKEHGPVVESVDTSAIPNIPSNVEIS